MQNHEQRYLCLEKKMHKVSSLVINSTDLVPVYSRRAYIETRESLFRLCFDKEGS